MALVLKQQIENDGTARYFWQTDKTGEYDPDTNEGGWGADGGASGNPDLNEIALLSFTRRNSETPVFCTYVDNQVKYSASYTNATELTWQIDVMADGYYSFWLIKIWASDNDTNSLDTYNARTFIVGDIWYNTVSGQVKQLTASGIEVLDLTDSDDIDTIINSDIVTLLLCEDMRYLQLPIKKQEYYNSMRKARREEDMKSISENMRKQMGIMLDVAGADYNFNGGLKNEAHDIVESVLDDNDL